MLAWKVYALKGSVLRSRPIGSLRTSSTNSKTWSPPHTHTCGAALMKPFIVHQTRVRVHRTSNNHVGAVSILLELVNGAGPTSRLHTFCERSAYSQRDPDIILDHRFTHPVAWPSPGTRTRCPRASSSFETSSGRGRHIAPNIDQVPWLGQTPSALAADPTMKRLTRE